MAKIEKICFEIETVTPMFLAGADGKTAELRPASLKGLLRYWWRALQSEPDLVKLRKKEAMIFGSSEDGIGGSSFSIRVAYNNELKRSTDDLPKHNITVTSKSRGRSFLVNILEYLAYGPCTYDRAKRRNVIVREYIQHGMKFTIHINFFKEDCISEILQAMYVFELFGGLGSKSRNGFGSFFIQNKEKCFAPIHGICSVKNPYTKQNLQNLVKQTDGKSYTSFARGTKIFKAKESYNTWDKALGEVGKVYRGIRSGDIKITDTNMKQKAFEKHFKYDKRQYIASPIIVDGDTKSFLERHAKPYFIKIAKEGDQYRAYILYLPSRYCDGLELDRNKKKINHSKVDNDFNNVCDEFNKYLASKMEKIL
ncbi:MAG: type III-B CRISPR module RAMP protein Cmr1 [Candidatus Brocadia sp.]